MKHGFLFVLVGSTFLLLSACGKTPAGGEETKRQEISVISVQLLAYQGDIVDTKTTYNTGSGLFLWAEGDAVGIISSEGSQLKFPIKEDYYGESYAKFDGRGFALLPEAAYFSITPFIADYDLDPLAVPISYSGQTMDANNSLTGLGAYAYAVAQGVASSNSSLDFSFLNVGSPHRYSLPAMAGNFKSLTLSIPEADFITEGTLCLQEGSNSQLITITPSKTSEELALGLDGVSLDGTGMLRGWMMMPPVDLTDQVIKLTLTSADGSAYLASIQGKDCPANSRRVFNALSSVYPAKQEIACDGGNIQTSLILSAESVEVTVSTDDDWITVASSETDGLVTTYSLTVDENTGSAREGTVSFTETSTGLTNTVTIIQAKAGTVIGIGGWDSDNHSGTAN